MNQILFCVAKAVLVLSIIFLMIGCYGFGPGGGVKPPASLEEVNQKIALVTKEKRELHWAANEERARLAKQAEEDSLSYDPGTLIRAGSSDFDNTRFNALNKIEREIAHRDRQLANLERNKERLLNESMGCFPPETMVLMEDGSTKKFADISVGDRVMTYDIGRDVLVGKPVVELYAVEANHMYTINEELKTTGGERLLAQGGWTTARNLKIGDSIHIDGQMLIVGDIRVDRVNSRVVNMQVADTHNFYVQVPGGSTYLVHNSPGGDGGGGGGGK